MVFPAFCRRLNMTRTLSNKLVVLVVCAGITMVLIELKILRETSGTKTPPQLWKLGSLSKNLLTRKETQDVSADNQVRSQNITNCPVLDFLATIDETARDYDPDLICDDMAAKSDIVCRLYFRQIGLEHLARSECALDNPKQVPKVVYFVIFGTYVFKFWHYIALMAARRNIGARAVYVIGDQHPMGRWWQQTLRDVHGVRFVYRELPPTIGGETVKFRHHLSDIVRLQVLYMNGGIYLDADMVVVRDVDPLLDYDITLGMVENGTGMGNAFIAAKRQSPFIHEWYTQYTKYKREEFYWNSLQVPRNMWFKNSSRVHIESDKLYRPNWFEADLLFKRSDYPWRNNYAVHIWTNGNPVPKSPDDIQTSNTTIAQIFRSIMYGDSKPRLTPYTKHQWR